MMVGKGKRLLSRRSFLTITKNRDYFSHVLAASRENGQKSPHVLSPMELICRLPTETSRAWNPQRWDWI
jgi:hypothetical protein